MIYKTVIYEKRGNIGIISLNRPDRLNALNPDLMRDLRDVLEEARKDEEVRVVILKGEGRAFCAGADVKEVPAASRDVYQDRTNRMLLQDIGRAFVKVDKPIIAAIRGYAIGAGFEFAINSDIRIVAEDAKFGFAEASVGATITTAAHQLLPRIVGLGKAKELMFTGDFIDAKEAERIGLANKVVPLEELDNAAMEMAKKIATKFLLPIKMMRICLDFGQEMSFHAMLELETLAGCVAFASGERAEGMAKKAETMKKN